MGLIGGSAPDPFLYPEQPGIPQSWNNLTGKTLRSSIIAAPSTTKVIIIGGQSNMATAAGTATYTPVSAGSDNLNPWDGGIYGCGDAVLGATFDGTSAVSSVVSRIADRIIANGKATRVIMVPIAVAGTLFSAWAPNSAARTSLFYRLVTAILRCRSRGLEPDFIIWGQGETDNAAGTSSASITASIQAIVAGIRAAPISCNTPFYVGKYSLNVTVSATVQAGIANALSAPSGIIAGYDADTNATVAGGFRNADNIHLSNTGLTLVANGWADLILP